MLVTRHRNFTKSYALQRSRGLLSQGLLTSEGEFHLRQRRLAQPAFHRERINEYARVMAAYDEALTLFLAGHETTAKVLRPAALRSGRWAAEGDAERPRFTYFPFGAGPRNCIGEAFTWTEATLLPATLARHWRARLVPGHPVATQPLITLRTRMDYG